VFTKFLHLQIISNFSTKQKMHALVVGATGATGKDLVDLLLENDSFQRVDIFVRRPVERQHQKLQVHVIDFDKPDEWRHLVKGDVLFSSLGTTLKAAGSKEAQRKIDYDYQYQFAKAARENGVQHYVLVSAGFASANSVLYYSKMKGQLEEAVQGLKFPKTTIFKPPMLIRNNTDRQGEVIGIKVLNLLNKVGLFRSQKPLPTRILAQAMINAAFVPAKGSSVIQGDNIWQLAEAGR
jgi:uncharacterized protein YbjT (DUF2867 family)